MKKTLEVLNELVVEKVIEGYALGGAVAAIDAKYELLVAMQKRSQAILAVRGKTRRVWPEN